MLKSSRQNTVVGFLTHPLMPLKANNELTVLEQKLLHIAARLYAAARHAANNPLAASQVSHFNANVVEEFVWTEGSLYITLM